MANELRLPPGAPVPPDTGSRVEQLETVAATVGIVSTDADIEHAQLRHELAELAARVDVLEQAIQQLS
jgi:cell division protein FtsB